jgi:hypothetical protein
VNADNPHDIHVKYIGYEEDGVYENIQYNTIEPYYENELPIHQHPTIEPYYENESPTHQNTTIHPDQVTHEANTHHESYSTTSYNIHHADTDTESSSSIVIPAEY